MQSCYNRKLLIPLFCIPGASVSSQEGNTTKLKIEASRGSGRVG